MAERTASASEKVGHFVSTFDASRVPAEGMHVARRALLDTIAVALAARDDAATRLIVEYVKSKRSDRMAHVWSTSHLVDEEAAALANGAIAHALDYDDVTKPLRGHPSVAIFPALVALAEARGRTVDDVVGSYVVGFEVVCRIAEPIVWEHYARGWHSTATIGMLGAAAASAHLLRLTGPQAVNALGIAVSHVAGTTENLGTMSKPLQAGHCASVGVRAACLAQLGFTASRTALDGKHGFTALYAPGHDLHASLEGLGEAALAIVTKGVDVKKYPMCYAAHRAIDGMLQLRTEHDLSLDAVERVNIVASNGALAPLIHDYASNGLEGKFSMHYAMAAALRDGRVGFDAFEDAAVTRPEVQAFMRRVTTNMVEGPSTPRWTQIEALLKNGGRLAKRVELLRGSSESPLSDSELLEKVHDCFRYGGVKVSSDHIADLILTKRKVPVAQLFSG